MNSEQTLALHEHLHQLPWSQRWLLSTLTHVHTGNLTILIDGKQFKCGNEHPHLEASIEIKRPFALAQKVIARGDLGFAESYMAGDWCSEDLNKLLNLMLHNQDNIGQRYHGSRWLRWGSRLYHQWRKNSLTGSKKNIEYHYDLGNDFYETWLDHSMTYSSALFKNEQDYDLPSAQTRKYQRIVKELGAEPDSHILEIGCGWGGFAKQALQAGHRVHGITLSQEQGDYAQQRLAPFGDKAHIELRDYRHLEQSYDHIVSIEMFEAVGEAYWDSYFEVLGQRLKNGGRAVLQIIIIEDQWFESYRRKTDFIQRYIFPGGMLPSMRKLHELIDNSRLCLKNTHHFGRDYAKTLQLWQQDFMQALPSLEALGYDEKFINMWHYYLAYCQAGFLEDRIDVVQITLEK